MSTAAIDLLQQRYGLAAETRPAVITNAITTALFSHRSVRAYLDKPLPDNTLETLLAAAQSAASSSNLQPWSLLAVEDPERKARLAALAGNQTHIRQAPLFLVWLADFSRIQRQADQQGVELQALGYLDSFLVGSVDAALAAQNAVVAAESLGLGTVYIGALRNNLREVIEELHLPPLVYPVFGLTVGYPDPDKPTAIKPRLPQAVVLHRETYSAPATEAQSIQDYDRSIAAFYQQQGLASANWSSQTFQRLNKVAALHGRERIGQVLKEQQFDLL
ncbi:NADPH-dependent oxidoreductase [Azomonas macrocytogenes]|uniref:Nitroreductase n=1 Tax=Azomonas macrocytogenes TaxID=69962 RepID=A0A839T257_AZOMA|nr:NADPH-dependent oxidoreductase [Azomonas macrocytogenes]MBB3102720.1 nitroreductase [Azomonas macrocytogenes]